MFKNFSRVANLADRAGTMGSYVADSAARGANTGFQNGALNSSNDQQVGMTQTGTANVDKQSEANMNLQAAKGNADVALNVIKMQNDTSKNGTSMH